MSTIIRQRALFWISKIHIQNNERSRRNAVATICSFRANATHMERARATERARARGREQEPIIYIAMEKLEKCWMPCEQRF